MEQGRGPAKKTKGANYGEAVLKFTQALLAYAEATQTIAKAGQAVAKTGISVTEAGISMLDAAKPFKIQTETRRPTDGLEAHRKARENQPITRKRGAP